MEAAEDEKTTGSPEARKKINNLVNTSNAKGRDNGSKTKTLIDTNDARDIGKKETQPPPDRAKARDLPANKTEEYMNLNTVITSMKEANDMETLFNAMKEAQKKARNLTTTVRNKNPSDVTNAKNKNDNQAKHQADIDNAVKLIEMEVISNVLEEAQRKALNTINDTVTRLNPDNTSKILGTATNKDRRPPPSHREAKAKPPALNPR